MVCDVGGLGVSSSKAGQHIVRDYRELHGHVVEMDNFFAWRKKDLFTFGQFALSRVLEPDSDAPSALEICLQVHVYLLKSKGRLSTKASAQIGHSHKCNTCFLS